MEPYIAVVGNGPLNGNVASEVDAAEHVLRFNVPNHNLGEAGYRTDLIFIGNTGTLLKRWIDRKSFGESLHFAKARRILFARHPDNIRKLHIQKKRWYKPLAANKEYTQYGISVLSRLGKEVSLCPPELDLACYAALGLPTDRPSKPIPSTGFLGVHYALTWLNAQQIRLYGFTWQGWQGHPWQAEYAWLMSCPKVIMPA